MVVLSLSNRGVCLLARAIPRRFTEKHFFEDTSMKPEAESMEYCADQYRAARRGRPIRRAMSALAAGTLALFLGSAEAGNVQFSTTAPAVVDTNATAGVDQPSSQPVIRRGREPAPRKLLKAAQTDGADGSPSQPNVIRALMPPVTDAEAAAHDDKVAREMPASLNANGAIQTLAKLDVDRKPATLDDVRLQDIAPPKKGLLRSAGISVDGNIVNNSAPPGPASVEELARALRYHPDLIYQYVRNNIEIEPVRGIHKGALGTILDNVGSASDQAQLMVSLLRASGYDARFVRGVIKLSAQQLADWYGVPTDNACAVVGLLGQGQIPIYSINATQAGNCPGLNASLTDVSIEHLWVKVNIGGTWYQFDPSYKPHVVKSGVDLGVAAGYSAASFLSTATSGATVTPDQVRGLNRNGIRSELQRLSTNLAGWIRKNKPTATIGDIIGGKAIVPFYAGVVRQTQNPLLDTRWGTEEWTDIPNSFKPTVRVVYQGIDQTFTSDAIYGKRLTITFNASNQPLLKLDGQQIGAAGTAVAPGADSVISFVVWHNAYPNEKSDHAFDQHIKGGRTYTFTGGKATRYDQPDGKAIDFTWSGDLLTKVANSVGRTLTLTYANNRLQTVASPQQTARYAYDASDNLASATDPDGNATRFEYDQPGRMTKFYQPSFPSTPVVTNTYDTLSRVQTQKSAAGNLYNYYFSGYRSDEVGPGGSTRVNYNDAAGNQVQIGDPMGN
jgi:YD repeat-containing protein